MPKQLLLVVGPGRSGTSVFSAIGQRLGYSIPQPEVQANETNPKGFGEPQWVVDFHSRVLGEANVLISDARPEAWARMHAKVRDSALCDELRRWLEQEFAAFENVLVKDPRSLWFFEMWQSAAQDLGVQTNYVTMLRHPAEVVLSRQTWYSTRVPPTGVLAGWMNTMLGTERLTRGLSRTFVDFDRLMDDWRGTIERVDEHLATDLLSGAQPDQVEAADDLIDPELRRSVATWEDVEIHQRLRVVAEEAWQALQELGDDPSLTSASGTLDELREAYEGLYTESEAIATSSVIGGIREERAEVGHKLQRARAEAREAKARLGAEQRGWRGFALRAIRLIPEDVRHAVPESVRQRIVDTARGMHRNGSHRDGDTASSTGQTEQPARIVGALESWQNRQRLVLDVVDRLSLTHFFVPYTETEWSLAIPESDRRRFIEALTAKAPADLLITPLNHQRRAAGQGLSPTAVAADLSQLRTAPAIALTYAQVKPNREIRRSESYACHVEFWTTQVDGALRAPYRNAAALQTVDPDTVDKDQSGEVQLPTVPAFRVPSWDRVTFPVDAVFLWVDSNDPVWQARRREYAQTAATDKLHVTSWDEARFRDRDELRYALRSVREYAPWVRRIFLVTAGQRPEWLTEEDDRITLVDHHDFFHEACLPTFNSNAIISRLHHIPGLAEHYVLMNDDVFLSRAISPSLFFEPNGAARFFLSPRQIPQGPQPEETALDIARRRVRELVFRDYGMHITRLLYHTPHPQRRSLHDELEDKYPELYQRTAANRFRDPSDLEPLLLHDYVGYLQGKTLPGSINYRYVATGSDRLPHVLAKLRSTPEGQDSFCLNDVVLQDDIDPDTAHDLLVDFLRDRFPVPAPWEQEPQPAPLATPGT